MLNSFYGFKKGQEQTFSPEGRRLVVTQLMVNPGIVKRIKTQGKDGYQGIVVEFKGRKKTFLRELRADEVEKFKPGDSLSIDQVFKEKDKVMISGTTRGKGFAGVVKRWGFRGGPKTHGQSDRERAPGSIGQRTTPGRVHKGKKMSGRMGGKTATIKNLKVFKVDKEKGELWLAGVVPGGKGGLVRIIKLP
jgi:large subunit ribosomal protein L3